MSDYHLRPKFDLLGRPQTDLHQLGDLLTLTTLCAQAGMPLRKVPGNYWALDVDDGGVPTATVSCPCGGAHLLPLMEGPHIFGTMAEDDTHVYGCPRGYTFDGADVWVLNGPTQVVAE